MGNIEKTALRLAACRRQFEGGYTRPVTEPKIDREHVDGPFLLALDGRIVWLSLLERLMTKAGIWGAWDIEWRRFPLPA